MRGARVAIERDHQRALVCAKNFLARESALINGTSELARRFFFHSRCARKNAML
jgi:hypothetical protein